MDSRQKHSTIIPPLCLEDGKRYQIKLTFDRYDENNPDPKASILIDSVKNLIFKYIFKTFINGLSLLSNRLP